MFLNYIEIYAGDINIDDEMLENVDTEKFGDKKPDHVIRYRVEMIYDKYFKNESVATQAQILRGLIRSKKLKEATSLLGIQKMTKDRKVKQSVFENITDALKSFGKSRKKDVSVARRVIQTTIVSSSNVKDRLTQHMEKVMGTSRKTLYKHRKF
jgi:ABC-type ATPase with predicted acetyltransferase domain